MTPVRQAMATPINFKETTAVGATTPLVTVNGKAVTVYVNSGATTTLDAIKTALTTALGATNFTVTDSGSTGTDVYTPGGADANAVGTTGTSGSNGGLAANSVFELVGAEGSQTFNFKAGTSIANVAAAINLATATTGVAATVSGTTLELTSSDYGSNAFVKVNTVSGSQAFTLSDNSTSATQNTGTDIVGTVNGTQATGSGQNLSLDTAALSLSANISAAGTYGFKVLKRRRPVPTRPPVVGGQQAQIGIQSVDSGNLGGTAGIAL